MIFRHNGLTKVDKKLLIQSLPLKIIEGKVNPSSIRTNFAPIELGICS